MTADSPPWSDPVRLPGPGGRPVTRRLVADEGARGRIARALGLDGLHRLDAEATVAPWLDGAELGVRWTAEVEQTCGVTLEPFRTLLQGQFAVRVVPAGSRNAPGHAGEVAVDPEAEDPPDVLDGDVVDLAAYVIEHLALEIDPFPRKPGAVFTPPEAEAPASPFAVLKGVIANNREE
jgi:uncharacterized metal-binding protein YceD (DUF177 family)